MEFKPKIFSEVQVNSSKQGPCSPPEIQLGEFGIKIKAPQKIEFAMATPDKFIPVCGYYQLTLDSLKKHSEPMIIYIRNLETDVVILGYMAENLPLISGHYEVYVEYGGVKSNREVIELKVIL